MVKDVEKTQVEKPDPIDLAINTPKDKMPQFTVIPTGGVVPFAMSKTIQQFCKKGAFDETTQMEYFIDTIFEYNRSRGGMMLGGLLKLAQTKAEVSADQDAEGKKMWA